MATSKVGTAVAEYRLDLRNFRKDLAEAQRGLKLLQSSGKGLKPIPFPSAPLKQYGDAASRAAQQALTLAQAEARLKAAQGDLPGAFERLSQALQNTDRSSLGAIRAQTQLANLANKMKGDVGGLAGVFGKMGPQLLSLAGSFGLATTAATAAVAALGLAKQGFDLNAQIGASRAALGAFLGDQARANVAFRDGAAFAEQYKIKQTEIAGALNSLAPLLKTSTTETEKQLEVLARLQTLRPGATFQDAAFSVKELAGGDYASIVEQFNLSRAAAMRLRDEVAAGADVFKVLDRELAAMGATTAVLETRSQGAAGAQNNFNKATEDLALAIGRLVEGPGTALLNWMAQVARGGAVVADGLAQFFSRDAQAQQAAAQALTGSAGNYDEYAARIAFVNQQLAGLGMSVAVLTPQQFEFANSLIATGVAADQAYLAADRFGMAYADALSQIQLQGPEAVAAFEALAPAMDRVASSSAAGAADVSALLEQFLNGEIYASDLGAALAALEAEHAAQASAAADDSAEHERLGTTYAATRAEAEAAAQAAANHTAGLNEQALASLEAAAADEEQTATKAALEQAIRDAAASGGPAVAASQRIAAQFGVEANRVLQLINLYRNLNAERGAGKGLAGGAIDALTTRSARPSSGGKGASNGAPITDPQQLLDEIAAADAGGGGGGGGGGKGKGRKGKGGGKGGKSEAEKAAEKSAREAERLAKQAERDRERQLERLQDLEENHQKKILSIQADYARRQLEQEKRNQISKIESRADFYDALTSAEGDGDISPEQAQKLASAYEAAFAESQRLAQEGKAALAADYLALRQEQIEAELAYEQKVAEQQQAIAEARKAGDEDAAKRAENELRRLEQIEAMRRQAREEELKQLLEGGDTNQVERDEALAAERQKYIESQAEILGVTEEVAAARVAGEERAAAATRTATDALREHLAMLQKVNEASVGRGAPPPASATSTTAPAEAPADGQAAGGAAAQPGVPTPGADGRPLAVSDAQTAAGLADIRATLARLAGEIEKLAGPAAETARNTADTANAVQNLSNAPLR